MGGKLFGSTSTRERDQPKGATCLGEWPATIDWIAILLIYCGVYFVSGGLLRPDG
jgi:hypothetical protein